MRNYINIDLAEQKATKDEIDGEDVIVVGRHLIAKTLLEKSVAEVDALSPENPLIFSAGPFAGSNFSNANRLSVGCKSPLTGGVKEANSGGTFAFADASCCARPEPAGRSWKGPGTAGRSSRSVPG